MAWYRAPAHQCANPGGSRCPSFLAPVAASLTKDNYWPVEVPETRYATTADGVTIAYQLDGEGDLEIVFMSSAWASNVDLAWEWSLLGNLRRGLAARGRTVWFDRRGTGLSDPVSGERPPTLEARMDDIRAVIEAVGFQRP